MPQRSEETRGPGLSRAERQRLKQEEKETRERRRIWRRRIRQGSRIGLMVVVVGGLLGGLGVWLATRKTLPPTSIVAHLEVNPPGHILSEPMPVAIQKHMLEHADGGGPPGVIIQYNCEKFLCADDLVENLTGVAKVYPEFVYLAPNPTMDARIALTRRDEILVLDAFDPEKIRQFIMR